MALSDKTARMIADAETRTRRWRWERWIRLVFGIVCVVGSAAIYGHVLAGLQECHRIDAGSFALMTALAVLGPPCILIFAGGLQLSIGTIARWQGDPVLHLLLVLTGRETTS